MTKTEWELELSWFQNTDGKNIEPSCWQVEETQAVWAKGSRIHRGIPLWSKTSQQLEPSFKALLECHLLRDVFHCVGEKGTQSRCTRVSAHRAQQVRPGGVSQVWKKIWCLRELGTCDSLECCYSQPADHCWAGISFHIARSFHFSRDVSEIQIFVWV